MKFFNVWFCNPQVDWCVDGSIFDGDIFPCDAFFSSYGSNIADPEEFHF